MGKNNLKEPEVHLDWLYGMQEETPFNCFFFFNFIYLWLCWVFVSVRGLSLVVASGGHSSSRCAGLSLSRPLLLRSTGSRHAGSVIVAHGPSCSAACGIFPDQGSNPCPLHWQADSQPLRHQGSWDSFYRSLILVKWTLYLKCNGPLVPVMPLVAKRDVGWRDGGGEKGEPWVESLRSLWPWPGYL